MSDDGTNDRRGLPEGPHQPKPFRLDSMHESGERPLNGSREAQRRELELQLQKIRSEASAARLEARAAEVELMIRRLSAPATFVDDSAVDVSADSDLADSALADSVSADGQVVSDSATEPLADSSSQPVSQSRVTDRVGSSPPLFQGWNEVREAMHVRLDATSATGTRDQSSASSSEISASSSEISASSSEISDGSFVRTDSAHRIARHHFESDPKSDSHETGSPTIAPSPSGASSRAKPDAVSEAKMVAAESAGLEISRVQAAETAVMYDRSSEGDIEIDAEVETDEEETTVRSRPAAWLVSALIHVAILVLLAAVGLTQHRPKDQVALTASPSAETVSVETFEIESTEPEMQPQPNEPAPSEVQYELSPVGEISASDLISDAPPAPPSSSMAAMSKRSSAASSSMSMQPNSDATMEFCGVKGGGNHFVYLVDSSGSMGDAFESARAELLRSIDLLKPEQRFYVVFFDAESDYMRLSDPNVDESRSVKASRVNRDALKRWAMRIQKDLGRAPYDALRFALQLKPDVIFLLSDGEFPQGIEDLLKEENRIVNLFGDDDPISIVHTISYHSKEGESRMRRIAEQNQGMYRYVPKP